jgi:hypothetical protein
MDELDKLLDVNRDNPPGPLELCLPLDRVLDVRWSTEVSKSILAGKEWTRMAATSALGGFLPEKPGLYMFIWRCPFPTPLNDDPLNRFSYVLYVGKAGSSDSTGTIKNRYTNEYAHLIGKYPGALWLRDTQTREQRLKRILNLRDLEFWFVDSIKTDEIEFHETTLIRIFNPPGNNQFKKSAVHLSGKLQKAISAF